jgi:hypothetical protein
MRTQEELVQRYREVSNEFLSFEYETIMPYLDYEHGIEFMDKKKVADSDTLKKLGGGLTLSDTIVIEQMTEYMEFAVEKACDHRGLSARRSISKMRGWLWLLNDNEMLEFIKNDNNYENYGAPILKKIIDKYGMKIEEATSEGF